MAAAEPPNARAIPAYVLLLQTDDADDQAEAMTQALRSRVRQAAGWSLLESSQSFETLTIALKCPRKPDAACLQRIGDQLHADHYVWGVMSKKNPGEVRAELHLWSRGRGDVEASESFTDNLKEANDPSLQQIAARLLGALTGGVGGGTLVIHAGTGRGAVVVDRIDQGTLEGGVARVDVGGGRHTVEVRVPGFDAPSQQTTVAVGTEQDLAFTLAPTGPSWGEGVRSSFPLRNAAAYSALVVGGGLLLAGGIEGVAWAKDNGANRNDRMTVPVAITDVCTDEISPAAADACQKRRSAVTASALAWVFTGVGAVLVGTGVVLLVTDGPAAQSRRATPPSVGQPAVQVLPATGAHGGTLDVQVTF